MGKTGFTLSLVKKRCKDELLIICSIFLTIITTYFFNFQEYFIIKKIIVFLIICLFYIFLLKIGVKIFRDFKLHKVNPILNFFSIIFLVCLFWIFLNVTIINTCDLVHYDTIIVFILASLILFFMTYQYKNIKKISFYIDKLGKKKYLLLLLVIMIFSIIQFFIAYALEYPFKWDASVVVKDAISFATNGHILDNSYYIEYQNNIGLLIVLACYFKFMKFIGVTNYLFSAIILNIIIMNVTIILIYLDCEKVFNTSGAVLSLIFSFTFIILSPWVTTPYTDVLSMIYPVFIFYLYLKSKETKNNMFRFIIYFVMGDICLIAYKIKPTSIIIMISIILVIFIINIKNYKKNVLKFVIIITSFMISLMIFNLSVDYSNIINCKLENTYKFNTPFTHFLMIGMQKRYMEGRGIIYGTCNRPDEIENKILKTKSNRIRYDMKEIKMRLKNFGFSGYLKFLSDKSIWIFSDGTFYSYGEGGIYPFFHNDKISKVIQNYMFIESNHYKYFSRFVQAMWITILFFIIYPLFCKERYEKKEEILILRLALLGILIFELIFEGRPRYLYNNIGIFIILAIYGQKICSKNLFNM